MSDFPGDVTVLLGRLAQGDQQAANELFPLVYSELRRIAAARLRKERPNQTLQPTALVNELWLRLAGQSTTLENRAHFFAMASNVMRQILVDEARKRKARKRGGGTIAIELDEALLSSDDRLEDVLAVDQALAQLEKIDKRQAQVVEMRHFAGLTEEEIALVLDISERTVKRDWKTAKPMLRLLLGRNSSETGTSAD